MRLPEPKSRKVKPTWRTVAAQAAENGGALDPSIETAVGQWRAAPALPERITSAMQYTDIDREAQAAARLKRRIEDFFAPFVEAAHAAHKLLCDRRRAYTSELEQGIEARNRLLIEWRRMVDARASESGAALIKGAVTQAGVSYRENWQARVVDESAVPDEYWIVDVSRLIQEAKRVKGESTIPGVEFYDAGTIARRTA